MSQEKTIYESLSWRTLSVPAEVASGTLELHIGEVGIGSPTGFLCAGVHGDEGPWGALALRELLDAPISSLNGRLRVLFAANPLAAQADARSAPLDHLDLNRSFPGAADGSHTQCLAHALTPFLEDADVLVDLHGGGSWCVNAFTFRFPGAEHLSQLVDTPFVVDMTIKEGTLSQHAHAHGAKIIAIEMGGRSRDELAWKTRISTSVMRILAAEGVLDGAVTTTQVDQPQPVGKTTVLRPTVGGMFVPTLREEAIGTVVEQGTVLGQVLDLHTLEPTYTFTAPFAETALLLLRPHICVLEGGAMTYVVAEPQHARS